jgi:hypothetical protein
LSTLIALYIDAKKLGSQLTAQLTPSRDAESHFRHGVEPFQVHLQVLIRIVFPPWKQFGVTICQPPVKKEDPGFGVLSGWARFE